MWPSPYLVCIPCVQELSAAQKELSQPSLSGEARKSELKKKVKDYEGEIQTYKKRLLDEEEAIKQLQDALGQLTCKYKDLALKSIRVHLDPGSSCGVVSLRKNAY